MTDRELMQQALDALEHSCAAEPIWKTPIRLAIEALRARLAQPEPEPVAWQCRVVSSELVAAEDWGNIDPQWHFMYRPLYTAPPQREWVGLTDEDIKTMWDNHIIPVFNKNGISPFVFARAIEAKLKEKNT